MVEQNFLYDEFLICTVREADENDKRFLEDYIDKAESEGRKIYYPARDTCQIDETGGYNICSDNCFAIKNSREVAVYWTQKSEGTKFDLGMAFCENKINGKKIKLVNQSQIEKIIEEQKKSGVKKSFEMVLLYLSTLEKDN